MYLCSCSFTITVIFMCVVFSLYTRTCIYMCLDFSQLLAAQCDRTKLWFPCHEHHRFRGLLRVQHWHVFLQWNSGKLKSRNKRVCILLSACLLLCQLGGSVVVFVRCIVVCVCVCVCVCVTTFPVLMWFCTIFHCFCLCTGWVLPAVPRKC